MSAVFGLALTLAAVKAVQGAAAYCDVTKNERFHQCYGALGKPVFIQLVTNTSGYQVELKHNNITLFVFRGGRLKKNLCCFDFFNNGTLRLDKAERNYSGQYTLEMYIHTTGAQLPGKEIQLILEEAVSIRGLSVACLPHGELRVSCSAGGDNPHYNWTLGDQPLGEDIPHMNSGDGVVLLGKGESGEITCTAWNNVSRESRTQSLPTCSELGPSVSCTLTNGTEIAVRMNTTEGLSLLENKKIFFTLHGREMLSALCYNQPKPTSNEKDTFEKKKDCLKSEALAIITVLLVVTVGVYFLYKRKKDRASVGDKAYSQDLVYADVRVSRNEGNGRTRMGKRAEPEVVYGEVKV
ncbi:uncharacterized protein LOC114912140 isoform X2 [Scleropages formosus]|uniref:uncharacterized protein LOC114912140 isoform X2 n=1 Tax=Scleropages formosus TaxID=113540 RepID=UPI0010FAA12C|nr:uncharacterized protein LOC114912140 isoform X2 [Scleropages formosus]